MDDELAAEFRNLGVAVEAGEMQERDFEVEPENVEALMLFLMLKTQWRYEAVGKRLFWTGFDYDAVTSTIRMEVAKKKRRREIFEALREMESAALPVLNGAAPLKGDEPWL